MRRRFTWPRQHRSPHLETLILCMLFLSCMPGYADQRTFTCAAVSLPQSIAAGSPAEKLPDISVECRGRLAPEMPGSETPRYLTVSIELPPQVRLLASPSSPLLRLAVPMWHESSPHRSSGAAKIDVDHISEIGEGASHRAVWTQIPSSSGASVGCSGEFCADLLKFRLTSLHVDVSNVGFGPTPLRAGITVAAEGAPGSTTATTTVGFPVKPFALSIPSARTPTRLCGSGTAQMKVNLRETLPSTWNAVGRGLSLRFRQVPEGLRILSPGSNRSAAKAADLLRATPYERTSGSSSSADQTLHFRLDGGSSAQLETIDIALDLEWASPSPVGRILVSAALHQVDGEAVAEPAYIDEAELIYLHPCRTRLVFPFVVSEQGWDTGVSVSNISKSRMDAVPHGGDCDFQFYQDEESEERSSGRIRLEPGEQLNFLVSVGGPDGEPPAVSDFHGHLVVLCDFVGARGYAFLIDNSGEEPVHHQGYVPDYLEPLHNELPASPPTGGASNRDSGSEQGLIVARANLDEPVPGQEALEPHAHTHASGGSDPVSPSSIGAAAAVDTILRSSAPDRVPLTVLGSANQSAPLQAWRNGAGELVGTVTSEGSAFFRELGLSSKTGSSVVSLLFQTDGIRRFGLLVLENALQITTYNDAGSFAGPVVSIEREGQATFLRPIAVDDSSSGGSVTVEGAYIEFPPTSPPQSPVPGNVRLFLNASNMELSSIDSTGNVRSLMGCGPPVGFTQAPTAHASRGLPTRRRRLQVRGEDAQESPLATAPLSERWSIAGGSRGRPPTQSIPVHAPSHGQSGSDPVSPSSIGALPALDAVAYSEAAADVSLTTIGAHGQVAPVSVWRDSFGAPAGALTHRGGALFSELGIASKVNRHTATLFFEVGGRRKFGLSSTDDQLGFLGYDDQRNVTGNTFRTPRSPGPISFRPQLRVLGAGNAEATISGSGLELATAQIPPTSGLGLRLFVPYGMASMAVVDSDNRVTHLGAIPNSGPAVSPCLQTCSRLWAASGFGDQAPILGPANAHSIGDGCNCFSTLVPVR